MRIWRLRTGVVLGAGVSVLALTASFGPLSPATAGGVGKWTKISGQTVSGINEAGLLRLRNGRLLVVYPRVAGNGKYGIGSTLIAPNGSTAATGSVLSGWDSLIDDPKPIKISGSRVTVVFSGILDTSQPSNPYTQGAMYSASASASASSWSLDTTSLSKSKSAYGSYGTGALALPDGTPVVSFPLGADITWHTGFDASIPAASADQTFTAGFDSYNTTLARDTTSGETSIAWYSNSSKATQNGTFVRRLLPSLGPITKAPGSSVGVDSLPNDEAVAFTGRHGAGGTYAAYCVGYPSCKHIALWRVGATKAKTVPHSVNAHHVVLAAGPKGRLWVLWDNNTTGKVYAVSTNPAATRFGAVRVTAAPKGASIYRIEGEGSATRKLDVVINTGNGLFHTQDLPGLSFAARPTKVHAGRRTVVTFTVTDAGAAVAKAHIKMAGKTALTNAKGRGSITLPAGSKTGRYKATARKAGFAGGTLFIHVIH